VWEDRGVEIESVPDQSIEPSRSDVERRVLALLRRFRSGVTIDGGRPDTDFMSAASDGSASEAPRKSLALMRTGESLVQLTGAIDVIADNERRAWIATTQSTDPLAAS
jgi:hypothetical protein